MSTWYLRPRIFSKHAQNVLVVDGPFAEAKEHIGGFWVIKAADLDEALKLAGEGAIACGGPVEVRPFQDEPESE